MFLKKVFDYTLAIILVIIFLLPLLLMWIVATIETGQNGIFVHPRIGQHGKTFNMLKIRTLKGNYTNSITTATTHSITRSGRIFIKYKLDELPQLLNILAGNMSFVGPRPDVAGYADQLQGTDRIILTVKPGITGPAQIKYKNEQQILNQVPNPQKYNDTVLWPDKVKINKKYIKNWSMAQDINYLVKTIIPT